MSLSRFCGRRPDAPKRGVSTTDGRAPPSRTFAAATRWPLVMDDWPSAMPPRNLVVDERLLPSSESR
eukprot:10950622-Alexandrium_andersonii.AAC.1